MLLNTSCYTGKPDQIKTPALVRSRPSDNSQTNQYITFAYESRSPAIFNHYLSRPIEELTADAISALPIYAYTPNSKKVALGIGNWALGSYCLAITQAKHFIVFICPNNSCPMPNCQCPKQPVLNYVYISSFFFFFRGYKLLGFFYITRTDGVRSSEALMSPEKTDQ